MDSFKQCISLPQMQSIFDVNKYIDIHQTYLIDGFIRCIARNRIIPELIIITCSWYYLKITADIEIFKSYEDMNLKDSVLRGVYKYGWEKPPKIQQKAIVPIIQG